MEDKKFKDEAERRAYLTEWAILNLVRELKGISSKGAIPTYYSSIKLGTQIMPEIFNDDSHIIKRHHEPELVRSYRQQAAAESEITGSEVEPLEVLDNRIETLNKQLATNITNKDLLEKELSKLRSIRHLFLPKRVQEDFILHHDVKSMKYGVQPINIGVKSADYQVARDRFIRVRLIHPNDGEQKMGADLIYEQYLPEQKKVRFLLIQYKIWEGELLYWSQAKNLNPQLKKMKNNLCDQGFCLCKDGKNYSTEFRYPYCSAYLRPTDALQDKTSPLTSSGMHIPICRIKDVVEDTSEGNKVLRKKNMRHVSLSQSVFEEAFNYNQIGSRWLDYEEVEKLYEENAILDSGERLLVHVQELEI